MWALHTNGIEVEAVLRNMKNGKEAQKGQVNIETLQTGVETIAKQHAEQSA